MMLNELVPICYICGKAIAGAGMLVSERGTTDRPMAVHLDCAEQLHEDVARVCFVLQPFGEVK